MLVECECPTDPARAHDQKTCAVHQTQLPAIRRQQSEQRGSVLFRTDPLYFRDRQHVLRERTHGLQSQAMLKKRARFDQDVIRDDQSLSPSSKALQMRPAYG
jgi:hypothetical protein